MYRKEFNIVGIESAYHWLGYIKELFNEVEADNRENHSCFSRESFMQALPCKNGRTVDDYYNEHVYKTVKTLLAELKALYNHVNNAALSREKYMKTIKYGNSNLENGYKKFVDKEKNRHEAILKTIRTAKASTNTDSGDDGNKDGHTGCEYRWDMTTKTIPEQQNNENDGYGIGD